MEKITLITQFPAHIALIMTLYMERNHINYTNSSSLYINNVIVGGKNHIIYTNSSSYNVNYDTLGGKKSH
jgi:hypothetical protein